MEDEPSPTEPLRLLALDGGGVRGLSSIIILKHIMKNIQRKLGRPVEPWQIFDMIGGTSTGGLLAIMLGRLKMSLKDCEAAYLRLSERIFNPKRSSFNFAGQATDFLKADGRFDEKVLESAVKEIITEICNLPVEELLQEREPGNPQCRVFVCATRVRNSQLAILRSYESELPETLFDECTVWEACRATSAAPTFFDSIKIGPYDQEFVVGGLLYNNPIHRLYIEASSIWPERLKSAVFLSIGTGSAPSGSFEGGIKSIVEVMKTLVTQTERSATDFYHSHLDITRANRYFRFNVYHGLEGVGLAEYRQRAQMKDATDSYLMDPEVHNKVKLYTNRLVQENTRIRSQRLELGSPPGVIEISQNLPMLDNIISTPNELREVIKAFDEVGINIESAITDKSWLLLHFAAKYGNLIVTEFLVNAGYSVTSLNHYGETPLWRAIAYGHVELVDFLISAGASVHSRDESDGTPLHYAASYERTDIVSLLLARGANASAVDTLGFNALHVCCQSPFSNPETVHVLINQGGISVASKTWGGSLAQHMSEALRTSSLMEALILNGAPVDIPDEEGQTALMRVVSAGYIKTFELLLKHKANINVFSPNCGTALDLAMKSGREGIFGHMLRLKPEFGHMFGYRGKTSLHLAVEQESDIFVPLLLKSGVDPNLRSALRGETSLHDAAQIQKLAPSRALLQYGADANARDISGFTPLHLAAQGKNLAMVKLLINGGSLINAKNAAGRTALHEAARKGRADMVKVLLKHGASSTAIDRRCRTPRYYAEQFAVDSKVKELLDKAFVKSNRGATAVPDISSGKIMAEISAAIADTLSKIRPFCLKCNMYPDGFDGVDELQHHMQRIHGVHSKWIVVDKVGDGKLLASCKYCLQKIQYDSLFECAAHLRRSHFRSRHDSPSPQVLEQHWIQEIFV